MAVEIIVLGAGTTTEVIDYNSCSTIALIE